MCRDIGHYDSEDEDIEGICMIKEGHTVSQFVDTQLMNNGDSKS